MNLPYISKPCSLLLLSLLLATAMAQVPEPSASATQAPIPLSSVNQLNSLLSDLEQASQSAQADLGKLRIDRWKTDSSSKRQTQGNVDSIQRNLQGALPQIVAELRSSPENLTSTFKLYRNLDALYDVYSTVVESAGAFGSKDEFRALENNLSALEKSRRSFADRMETLSGSKDAELTRLRTQLQNLQAAAQPAKKVIVDDTAPAPKKPTPKKKKPVVPKPPSATTPGTSTNPSPPSQL